MKYLEKLQEMFPAGKKIKSIKDESNFDFYYEFYKLIKENEVKLDLEIKEFSDGTEESYYQYKQDKTTGLKFHFQISLLLEVFGNIKVRLYSVIPEQEKDFLRRIDKRYQEETK